MPILLIEASTKVETHFNRNISIRFMKNLEPENIVVYLDE